MLNQFDLKYLKSVNNLSFKNLGQTGVNPSVACLIVDYSHEKQGIIISSGLTSLNGRPHAEFNALNKIKKRSLNRNIVMYVSLEPCFKKTSCCARLISASGIKKVVIASIDPNPQVKNLGIEYLRSSGVMVELAQNNLNQFKIINKQFYSFHTKHRPFITLKLAISKNGYTKNFKDKNITSSDTQYFLHRLRLVHDAIAVGYNTVKDDSPRLNCRLQGLEKNLKRFLISRNNQTIHGYKTINISEINFPNDFYNLLKSNNVQSLLIEGGLKTFMYFINCNLFDEVIICQSNKKIEQSNKKFMIDFKIFSKKFKMISSQKYDEDQIHIYKNK